MIEKFTVEDQTFRDYIDANPTASIIRMPGTTYVLTGDDQDNYLNQGKLPDPQET